MSNGQGPTNDALEQYLLAMRVREFMKDRGIPTGQEYAKTIGIAHGAELALDVFGGIGKLAKEYGEATARVVGPLLTGGPKTVEDYMALSAFGAGATDIVLRSVQSVSDLAADAAEWAGRQAGGPFLGFNASLRMGEGPFTPDPEAWPLRRVEDFMVRARSGSLLDVEVAALNAGLTPDQVAALYSMGELAGFTLPMMASFGLAGIAFNLPKTMASTLYHPLVANAVTDFVAGGIYGGLFQPAESNAARVKNVLNEAAVFGVLRLGFNTIAAPWSVAASRRFLMAKESGEIEAILNRVKSGRPTVLTEEQGKWVAEALSTEEYVLGSVGAQILIQKGAARAAIVQGIIDSAGIGSTSGIIRGTKLSFDEVSAAVREMKGEFKKLKFDVVKNRSTGDYDIVFGTQGLSNQQKAQLAKEGRFLGMEIQKNGATYTYVSSNAPPPTGKEGKYIYARTSDGKVVRLKDENITDLYAVRERVNPTEEIVALENDFHNFSVENMGRIETTGIATEGDVIEGLRKGNLKISDSDRRPYSMAGTITHPESMGLVTVGEESIVSVRFERETPSGIEKAVLRRRAKGEPFDLYSFKAREPSTSVIGGFEDLNSGVEAAQKSGWNVIDVRRVSPGADEITESILKEGAAGGGLMPSAFKYITFDDEFILWARARGIPEDTEDFLAMKAFFAQRRRERAWEVLPDDAKNLLNEQRELFWKQSENMEIPLSVQARLKGLHFIREEGHFALRDINTGATVRAESEGAAKTIINNVRRKMTDGLDNTIPFDGVGLPFIPGWRHPGEYLNLGNHVNPEDFTWVETAPILTRLRNVRDLTDYFERQSGFPIFTQGFDRLLEKVGLARREQGPWAREISKIWKPLSMNEKIELAKLWGDIEGSGMTMTQATKFLKDSGMNSKQIAAWVRARKVFDAWHEIGGLPREQFIDHYFSRVPRFIDTHGRIPRRLSELYTEPDIPKDIKAWFEFSRTGELSNIELDPEVVMHRYARTLFFKKHVEPEWKKFHDLLSDKTTPRIRSLPKDIQASMLKKNPRAGPNSPLLPFEVLSVYKELLQILRGTPDQSVKGIRDFARSLFNSLKIDADERVLEEFIDLAITNMYGAAMAARPMLVARNLTQTMWMLYPRLGNRWGADSFHMAMTKAGYERAYVAGAIRSQEAGVMYGDVLWEHIVKEGDIVGRNLGSQAIAATMKSLMRAGHISSKFGRWGLGAYSWSDDFSRAWSFWWQRMHTEEWLEKYESAKISWEKFEDEGLPFFQKTTKREFQARFQERGREAALDYAGRIASDESQFIYGMGAQPALLQNPFFRMFGMFGTWPLWGAETYFNRFWKEASFAKKAAFVGRTVGLAGIFTNMSLQTGFDFMNWMAPGSILSWSGGPVVDHAVNLWRLTNADWSEKDSALRTLINGVGRLAMPGSIAYQDIMKSMDSDDPAEAAMLMFLGKPIDNFNFAFEYIYNPINYYEDVEMYRPPIEPGGTR